LQKGQRALIDGRLQISRFQRKDGTPGVAFDVWADEVQNVSGRDAADAGTGHSHVAARTGEGEEATPGSEEDLPF
jgi:single-stranded DNA-binding protein